ncbi:MAG: rhodanese-like domain-containing protein [Firmicutes bacterium HGW-Firmicutes-1]|nr:MAG: rhodanese-like domain-containing protein [Firmicutes bacterium HGW-Firmicutes-1]
MKGSYYEITYKELLKLQGNKNYILIDIRPKYEYEKNHIQGALSVPEYELINSFNRLNINKTYIFICQRGKNSKDVANTLMKYGFHTLNLYKGMEAVDEYEEEKN